MKISMLIALEVEVISEFDEEKDEIIQSDLEVFKKDEILEVEEVESNESATKFQLGNGSVFWVPNEVFEVIEE